MTRDEAFAAYLPIHTGIQDALEKATRSLFRPDIERAARQLGFWHRGKIDFPDDPVAPEMLNDVALFEANAIGVRPIDRFLQQENGILSPGERAIAERAAATARMSFLRFKGKHPIAGVILIDRLDDDREIWLMDQTMDATPPPANATFAMRIFDAGPYHVGFGFAALPSELTIMIATVCSAEKTKLPFRFPLSSICYADSLGTRKAAPGPLLRRLEATVARLRDDTEP